MDEKSIEDAFVRTNTIHLSHSFELHFAALNPTKDLVALYRNLPAIELQQRQAAKLAPNPFARRAPIMPSVKRKVLTKFRGEGHETAEDEDETAGAICIGLWRSISNDGASDAAGPSVTPPIWEVDMIGRELLSMSWNVEGTLLSVLLSCNPKEPSPQRSLLKLAHLSLQDGGVVDVSYIASKASITVGPTGEMFWSTRLEAVPSAKTSNRLLDVLESLPKPNHVEDYLPAIHAKLNQNRPAVDKSTPALVPYHPILGSFPGCAKTVGPTSVLCISGLDGKDSRGASFLGGSFPLPHLPETQQVGFERVLSSAQLSSDEKTTQMRNARPTTDEITIAEASSAAKSYLDMILRSIQACQGIWRDDIDKEHDRWVDELEDAARTHGTDFESAHADLTRLLLTGRCSEGVTQFLGGRITDKTLSAWETTYREAVRRIQNTIKFSLLPACERVILVIESLVGTSIATELPHVDLDLARLKRSLDWARHLAIKANDLDAVLGEEISQFREFARWLRYEIARAAAGPNDDESLPSAPYDVLSVCDYLVIFPAPPSAAFFLTIDQQIGVDWPQPSLPQERTCPDLAQTIRQRKGLDDGANPAAPVTTAQRPLEEVRSQQRSKALSKIALWSIADVLVHELACIFKTAITSDVDLPASPLDSLRAIVTPRGGHVAIRHSAAGKLRAFLLMPDVNRFWIWTSDHPEGPVFRCGRGFSLDARPSDVEFFDENEIIMTVRSKLSDGNALYLATIRLDSLTFEDDPINVTLLEEMAYIVEHGNVAEVEAMRDITDIIERAYKVDNFAGSSSGKRCLASNGRANRRLICVSINSGKEIGVFE